MTQLGQTVYVTRNVNGNDIYQTMDYGGNIPWGYSEINKDAYVQGLTKTLNTAQDQIKNGLPQGYTGNTYNANDVAKFQQQISDANNNQGVNAPGYNSGGYSQFNPNGQPNESNYTPAEQVRVANIPINLGGTAPFKAAPNLGGASPVGTSFTSTPLPAPTPINNGSVPTGNGTTPTFPPQTGGNTTDSYYASLTQQVTNLQQQLDTQRQQQLDQINQQKQAAQSSMDSANSNEQGAIANEQKAKLDQIALEEQRFNDNYNTVQGLAGQLTDLMTQGNALIQQQKGVTGLASIRDPRIAQTISSVTASVGVIQAAISTYNGQMSQARDQLASATSAITSAYSDQINYYDSIRQFYQTGVVTATKAQNDFVNTIITNLQNKVDTANANATALQNEFLDPTKALAFAQAGITINTPQDQWGPLLAKAAYSKELSTQSKDMADKGYSVLNPGGKAPSGATIVTQTDSQGKTQTYYKPSGFILGKDANGNPISINKETGLISSVSGGGGGPPSNTSANQYTVTAQDVNGYDSIAPKLGITADVLRAANPNVNEHNLQIGQKINTAVATPYKAVYGNTKVQDSLEKDARTAILSKEFMGRANGFVVNDLKVGQANKAAALFNASYDPATGNYNIKQAQYGELATALASLLGGSTGATDTQRSDIQTATAKGDFGKAYTYLTGQTANGSTQDVIKLLASSINREAIQAMSDRDVAGNNIINLASSSDLDPARKANIIKGLNPLQFIGINGLSDSHAGFSLPSATPTYNGFTLPH